MSDLSDDYVRSLAYLARIRLSDGEVAQLKPQLAAILGYVQQLNQADSSDLPATSQVTGLAHVSRPDNDTADTMASQQLLDQIPSQQDGQIKVPKVI